jgi:hypothetical protein
MYVIFICTSIPIALLGCSGISVLLFTANNKDNAVNTAIFVIKTIFVLYKEATYSSAGVNV